MEPIFFDKFLGDLRMQLLRRWGNRRYLMGLSYVMPLACSALSVPESRPPTDSEWKRSATLRNKSEPMLVPTACYYLRTIQVRSVSYVTEMKSFSKLPAIIAKLLTDALLVRAGLQRRCPTGACRLEIVFASLKGGVGRSTALAVAASDLASRGRNVLVIDLDLEAPGLGEITLDAARTPMFGVLDYLVEDGIGGIPNSLLDRFVGTSSLTVSAGGRVDVVPALGTRSAEVPENILPKLARAMIEDMSETGVSKTPSEQISAMIDQLSQRQSYDAILIDSRAGLSELAAPAVLGLGALVLLFGTAQRQTISGYRPLFSGLKLLATRALERGENSDWRLMFKPVYAKASLDPVVGARYTADLYDLFADNLYDKNYEEDQLDINVNFSADDPDAPHAPLVIPFDPRLTDFDPLWNTHQLTSAFYEQTFRPFLNGLDRALEDLRQDRDRTSQ